MIIEIVGKGIVCDVFYIATTEFDRIVSECGETGIESKIRENCDESISVSRGFFFDGVYNYPIKLKFPNHEILIDCGEQNQAAIEESWRKALPKTHPFAESDDWYETLGINPNVVFPDPTSPITAIFSPLLTLKEILLSAFILVSLKVYEIFLKIISPSRSDFLMLSNKSVDWVSKNSFILFCDASAC